MNLNSAFLDSGPLYGSDADTATKLRTGSNGTLKVHHLGPTLPTQQQTGLGDKGSCTAGDPRATVQPGLTSLYTLMLNEHNRIADKLKEADEELGDEELYQRARSLVIAQVQNIVFKEFLPLVIGPDWMSNLTLPTDLTEDTSYNSATDPGIYNEFATVAFRFGHALIPNSLQVSNLPKERTEDTHCPIKDNYFKRKTLKMVLNFDTVNSDRVLIFHSIK